MYYKTTPTNGQSQVGQNYPELRPEKGAFYATPEALQLEKFGQKMEWLRQSAVITGRYDYDKVEQLAPLAKQHSVVGYMTSIIFGGKNSTPQVTALDRTAQLLRAEAILGGDFFAQPDDKSNGITREFMEYSPDSWVYCMQMSKNLFGLKVGGQDMMIQYDIRGGAIQKRVTEYASSNKSRTYRDQLKPGELDNLLSTAEAYTHHVARAIYPELYAHYHNQQIIQQQQHEQVQQYVAQSDGEFAFAA